MSTTEKPKAELKAEAKEAPKPASQNPLSTAATLGLGQGSVVYNVGKFDAVLDGEVLALAGGAYQQQLLQGTALWSRPASSRPALVKRLLMVAEAHGLDLICVKAIKGGATGIALLKEKKLVWTSLRDEPTVVGTADVAIIRQVRGK